MEFLIGIFVTIFGGYLIVLFLGKMFSNNRFWAEDIETKSAKQIFNEILIKNGIEPSELGDECINELLQNAHEIASMLTKIDKSKYYSTEFMNSVKGKAFKAVEYMLGEKEFDKNDYLCEILARHKVLKRVE